MIMKAFKNIALAFILVIIGPAILKADEDAKTLPPGTYQQMKHGKKLDKIWLRTDYDKTKGFKIGTVDYKAENRNGTVMDYMPKALATLAKTDSPFTLQVAIIKVTTKTFTGFGNKMGKVTLEGKIVDPTGKVVAAFVAAGSAGSWGSGSDDYQAACDQIASGMAVDLL